MAESNEDLLTSSSENAAAAAAALSEVAIVAGDRQLLPPIYFRVGGYANAGEYGEYCDAYQVAVTVNRSSALTALPLITLGETSFVDVAHSI